MAVPEGTLLSTLPTPTATEWTFTGWSADADASAPLGPLAAVTDNMTLFAGWEQVSAPVDTDDSPAADDAESDREGALATTGCVENAASFAGHPGS